MALATEQDIIQARIRMLLKETFFGVLATRLKIVDASEWIPTCATDGRHLYFNAKFFGELDKSGKDFVIAHEVLHCVYDHLDRRGGRDSRLWNCAADYAINYELVEVGFKMPKLPNGKELGLYDKKYAGMTANEIYDILKEKSDKGEFGSDIDAFDVHLSNDGSGNSNGDGKDSFDETGKTAPIPLSEEDKREIENEIKQAIQQAIKNCDPSGKGLPARIKRYVDALNNNKIHWADFVNKQIQSSIINDFHWSKPNRKVMSQGIILPSSKKEGSISVAVGVDTSGSINKKMFTDFITEVYGIMQQFASYEIFFFCWDATCYTLHRFDETNADDLLTIEFEGGGGNDGIVFIEKYLEENDVSFENLVLFTDGHILGDWDNGTPPHYADKTTFVIWGSNIVPPWGSVINY